MYKIFDSLKAGSSSVDSLQSSLSISLNLILLINFLVMKKIISPVPGGKGIFPYGVRNQQKT